MKNQEFVENLIAELDNIPKEWRLIPVDGNKSPELWKGWRKGFERDFIKKEIKSGRAKGFGLLTGTISGGILAIDCDGEAAHKLAEEWGGIPHTVSWSSGLPGRAQYLVKVPQEFWGSIATKKIKTGVVGSNGKEVLLELRWDGCQSVFRGEHPETGSYKSINDLSTPIAECSVHFIEKMLVNTRQSNPDQLPLNFNNNSSIPLYNFLSKNDRQLIDNGALNGSRNDNGAKLARNLLGTAQRLNYLGYQFDGNPEDLFNDFCDKCNPSINNKERQTIWKSALKSNPTSTLTDDYLENIYKSFHRQQQRQIQPSNNGFQTSGTAALKPEAQPEAQSNIINFPRQQQQSLNVEDIEQEFSKIAEQNLTKSKLQLKLNELAKKCNYSPKEIAESYKNYLSEIEGCESLDDVKSELEDFLNNKKQAIDTSKYLPGNLNKITELAQRLCLRPELALTIFYTTISSLLKVGTEIDLTDYTSFPQPMGIYSAIVAEPSQRKSPLINAIATQPLREILKKSKSIYTNEMTQYKIDLKDFQSDKSGTIPEPVKPVMRHYYVNSGTGAGMRDLINEQAQNTWGITLLADEISGWFKSQSQSYNTGMKEDFLSYYDGFGKRDALKDGLASDFEECLVSVLGGIQPGVFKEFNDGSDDNGAHARFNFVHQPTSPFIIPDNPPGSLDLLPLLSGFYERIASLPQLKLRLSPEAKKHFEWLNNKCEERRVNAKSLALAALWGKMPGKIGRFTALIHVVEQLSKGNSIDPIVGKVTLTKAAKLAKFYYKEAENLYITCEQGNLTPTLAMIIGIAEEKGEPIAARDVVRHKDFRKKEFKDLKSADVIAMFTQLVEMGKGEFIGTGRNIRFSLSQLSQVVTTSCDKPKAIQDEDSSHLSQLSQEKNKNLETQPISMDDSTLLDEKSEMSKTAVTIVTEPENECVETVSPCHNNLGQTVTIVTNSGEYPAKLEEMVKAEPLPPLTNMACRINFDSLQAGETIFDSQCRPFTLKQLVGDEWLTNGCNITRSNIGNFHRAPKTGWE